MKKKLIIPVAILLVSMVSFQSCIGSFTLTNKVLSWNKNVSNKFVNELVFFAFWILPVYEVTGAADMLVINSIEFWSGNNPLEAHNKVIETEHGNYQIMAGETGYKVSTPEGGLMCFDYDKDTSTWSFSRDGKEKIDFLKFEDENHVKIITATGDFVDVELNEEGVNNYLSTQMVPMMAMN